MVPMGKRKLSTIRALLLLAPVLFVAWWLWRRPTREISRYDDALDRALAPVMEQREVKAKLGAVTSAQARLLARDLAEQSIQYLAPRDLELWQATRARVAEASPARCAKLWKGGSTEFLGPAIAALGDDALDAYVAMLARALALRLERKPPPEPSVGALRQGFDAIAAQMPADAAASFRTDVARRELTDARACELFRSLSAGIQRLEPAQRVDFLRALAKALQAPAGL
jgi:hypothetical protein